MRILLSSNHVPFVRGGAEACAEMLHQALVRAGHRVERVSFPFQFHPETTVEHVMRFCEGLDLGMPNGQTVDRLISLQFPGYGCRHPRHVGWILHQHRAVYELYDESRATPELQALRERVHDFDARTLARLHRLFTISRRVAERLEDSTGLRAEPLYQPPPGAEYLRPGEAWDYLFFPSRLETLKRQDLLIEAARLLRCPVKILIGGTGGQYDPYARLIEAYGLGDRVRLLGEFSDRQKAVLYAHALGVVFVPFDEDLGYVTLEAMLAGKPVITCTDSGGPLEFVVPGITGWVVEPTPEALAEAIEALYQDPARAHRMGADGRDRLLALDLSWDRVAEALCS